MRGVGREWAVVYLKGLCMGAADAVPGVSGGTIALITGIYERLVAAVAAIDPHAVALLVRAYDAEAREELRDLLVEMDTAFLLALGAGILSAVVTVVRVIDAALTVYPAETYAFFFGLIAASAVVLRDAVSLSTPRRVAAGAVGLGLALVVAGNAAGGASHALPVVFASGAIAVTAMILPGVSGSLLLIILGQYDFMLETLVAFTDAVAALAGGGSVEAVLVPGVSVVAFVAGAVVGLLSVARAVRWALARYRAATLTFLVALMVGGLRAPGTRIVESTVAWTPRQASAVVLAALVGAAVVVAVDRYTDDLEYDRSANAVGRET